jgi:sorting nexin-9/18/33
MQKTAETLQHVADLYDDHVRVYSGFLNRRSGFDCCLSSWLISQAHRRQLATHEGLKNVAHPSSIYKGVVNTHQSTLTRYREAMARDQAVRRLSHYTSHYLDSRSTCRTMTKSRAGARRC